MPRLAASFDELKPHYTCLVVGSGYGGAIAASRFARAGQDVAILERGREIQTGEFPDTLDSASPELQANTPDGQVGSPTGLVEVHVNAGQNVLVGCGLGGTSLINANVALEPVRAVFDDPAWPQGLKDDLDDGLAAGYARARDMLQPQPYPDAAPRLAKLEALAAQADALGWGEQFYRPPINVSFEDHTNPAGVAQKACALCGDCCSGCNYGAKNTLMMNYLPDAWNFGAQIFTQVRVSHLSRGDGFWNVHCRLLGLGRDDFDPPETVLTAEHVVLGAGTVGTTEILLRSKAHGLPLSDQVGEHVSGNGDVLAFGYNCDRPIHGIGYGNQQVDTPVGPCITGIVDHRQVEPTSAGYVIEEGVAPGAIGGPFADALAIAGTAYGKPGERGIGEWLGDVARKAESFLFGDRTGAADRTQIYLAMAHDKAPGRAKLEQDRIRIVAPEIGEQPIFDRINATLKQATHALSGTHIRNPIWTEPLDDSLISVHPLGGARMGEDAAQGAIGHDGRLFAGASGTAAYDDLLVTDGAAMPMALGVNPLLTISALAERALARHAARQGWQIDMALPVAQTRQPAERPLGLSFTERMQGHVATAQGQSFAEAERAGEAAQQGMHFTLTVLARDLDRLLDTPEHEATLLGTVTCPLLDSEPLTVAQGRFNLFVEATDRVKTRYMRYRAVLHARSGRRYCLDGYKQVDVSGAGAAWDQTSTLYTTVYDGPDSSSAEALRGVLHIAPADFAKQLATFDIRGAASAGQKLDALTRFGSYFAGVLWEMYSGIAHKLAYAEPGATPRPTRKLRTGPGERYPIATEDGAELLLTRYRGGSKGPLMMVHGATVSSEIFSTDLMDTNLLEYFYERSYDVWLLDWRMSIALPCSKGEFDLDRVAAYDYKPAIAQIRSVTGAADIQALVHCVGSITFFMALLNGLEGVRSVVSLQSATHFRVPAMTQAKAALHLPSLLDKLGVDGLTGRSTADAGPGKKLLDQVLKLQPELGADNDTYSPVNQRLNFMFGGLFEVHNLPPRLYDNLYELFGFGNMRSFQHLAELARTGHLVTFDGADSYLDKLARLKLPIRLIHGGENATWLPESTELTLQALQAANGPELYSRKVAAGYGHQDTLWGQNAPRDTFPLMAEHFEATAGGQG